MKLKDIIKSIYQIFLKNKLRIIQKFGINITPNNYYSPIPDLSKLNNDIWTNRKELCGVNLNEEKQQDLLSHFVTNFKSEYDNFPVKQSKEAKPYEYYLSNEYFGPVDSEILYSMIRYFKPRRIIEIGSGFSTYCSAKAILRNYSLDNNYNCELIAIEPYPKNILIKGFPGLKKLIPKEVQNVPITEFTKLKENDILFIDSSHVIKIGNDVQYEYLEIIPRLRKGVIIHIHDIYFPFDYPKRKILIDNIFWNEQYLLQAFLSFNNSFEVLWAGNFMNSTFPNLLENAFNSYRLKSKITSSFWMRKIK